MITKFSFTFGEVLDCDYYFIHIAGFSLQNTGDLKN